MKKVYLTFIGLILLQVTAFNQQNGYLLSLADAVQMAMDKNPQIKQLQQRIEQKGFEWKTELGISSPEIHYAREGISDNPGTPFSEQRFGIQQEIDFPLTTHYRIKRINKEKQSLNLELENLKKEVRANVKKHYIEVLYALFLLDVRKEENVLERELYEAVKARVEGGVATDIDLLATEIRLAESENDLNDADKILHEARYGLFNYIGLLPGDQNYSILFADTLMTHEDRIRQEEAMNTLERQPLYRSMTALIESAGYSLKEQQSGYLPGLRLGYLSQDFATGFKFHGLEAGLKIPLWGMFEQRGKVQMSRSKILEYQWMQTEVLLEQKMKIERAWHGYINSKSIVERYNADMKQRSERLRSLTLEAYRLGQIDVLKLIEAQRIYLNSQLRYLDAVKNYYIRLAELELFMTDELVY